LSTKTPKLAVCEKKLFYSSSLFHPLEHFYFFRPLLQFEKVGNPIYTAKKQLFKNLVDVQMIHKGADYYQNRKPNF